MTDGGFFLPEYSMVERYSKEKFFKRRVKGEIFSVDFERACAAVEDFATTEKFK
ncbi:MAG: hypothetical protein SR1Q7_06305 [Quinella sp. 1Q7]|nr:hypothetical protein [Quinella sp. 1Q7]